MAENVEIRVKKGTLICIVIIIVLLLVIGGLCWHIYSIKNGDANINKANDNSNTISSGNNNDKTNDAELDTPDEIAKELFRKGAELLAYFATGNAVDAIHTEYFHMYGDDLILNGEKTTDDGGLFYETMLSYEEVEEKYSEIFIKEALDKFMAKYFLDVNGVLYANAVGGGTGFGIANVEVIYISQSNGRYTYKAIFDEVEDWGMDGIMSDTKTSNFVIEKVGDGYKISKIEYAPSI